ncbi:hypothetical protein N657DRAFT_676740 [Parathielavia appendiculata]|uniref:Rhodopsin domain-containing protein n=1 Tax=Parathielavia appendiculata TaxID=2587402 RepID=A0AAN6U9R5_9PEZI|nr:hypothetical protein N657DRAFT_676740 [Parathielavia appendiculata]
MVWDTSWSNSTFGNFTIPPPNSTLWQIPPDAGRSLQPDIIACAVVTFLAASTFVVLRFYTRGWVNHVLGASDWCILPALLCAAGVTASSLEQVAHGAGKHAWETDPFKLPAFERAAWYGILFYNLSLTLTRISILLLYKRIFNYGWIKRVIQIVLVLIVASGIWLVVAVCTACMPLQAFWDWSLYFTTRVYCQPPNLWWANAALHITSDLVIMALPMPVLSSLNLPRRQKYAIVGLFALGFGVCIISVVRLVALIDLTELQAYDATYTSAYMIYWTTVEVNAAIACACVMTLKPFIQRVFPRLLSPSKGIREPTLQWITPVNNDSHTRNSLPPASPTSPLHRYQSRGSNTSTPTNKNRRSGSLPHLYEYEMSHHYHHRRRGHHHEDMMEKSRYYHSFTRHPSSSDADDAYDLDHDLDLEAQRTCSSSITTTTTAAGDGDGDTGGAASSSGSAGNYDGDHGEDCKALDPGAGGALRAPPRAQLRLSIHVMREVVVESESITGAWGAGREEVPAPVDAAREEGGNTKVVQVAGGGREEDLRTV